MDNYIDFSKFSGQEIKMMLREKQKEYIILIQSEKIAKEILGTYNEPLYATNTDYLYRVNKEYYSLCRYAQKKHAVTNEDLEHVYVSIPLNSIIARLEDNNRNEEKKELYNEIINDFNDSFQGINIYYKDGFLFFKKENEEEVLFDSEILKEMFNNKGNAYRKK